MYTNPVANSLRAREPLEGPKLVFFFPLSLPALQGSHISFRVLETLSPSGELPPPQTVLIRLLSDGLLSAPCSEHRRCSCGSDYDFISCMSQAGGGELQEGLIQPQEEDTAQSYRGEAEKSCPDRAKPRLEDAGANRRPWGNKSPAGASSRHTAEGCAAGRGCGFVFGAVPS